MKAVWSACVLFFQSVLLVGYLYAHLSVRWFGARRQAVPHHCADPEVLGR